MESCSGEQRGVQLPKVYILQEVLSGESFVVVPPQNVIQAPDEPLNPEQLGFETP
jgi:hypothetical protein